MKVKNLQALNVTASCCAGTAGSKHSLHLGVMAELALLCTEAPGQDSVTLGV